MIIFDVEGLGILILQININPSYFSKVFFFFVQIYLLTYQVGLCV